ncbi:hypothetical protein IFM89_002029 [Coptis chinensis]|uniref:Uncharacterized protein n=1 Tax=Coptis chinensis TaxID=261450 RepID=A0A835GUR6_9MAGN|nr:hypothetical protein IFM89_002029 [Coptis chinensis]
MSFTPFLYSDDVVDDVKALLKSSSSSLLSRRGLLRVNRAVEIGVQLRRCTLPNCWDRIAGLEDLDDDVRAVSADALIPAAASIVSHSQMLQTIVMLLWDILLDLDDLSPSTSRSMPTLIWHILFILMVVLIS